MIKTSTDFNTALEELSKAPDITFSVLDRKMSAETYNDTMNKIEDELNSLYEGIRLLNDVADFCESYVIKNVRERREKFLEKLKVIEDLSDSFRDTDYVTQLVPFVVNQKSVKDRRGKEIPPMKLSNGCLEMDGESTGEAKIKSAFQLNSDGCYKNTASNLLTGGAARSEYYMDEPAPKGVQEEYEIRFQTSLNLNYINIDTSNCEVEKLQGINADNSVIDIKKAGSFIENNLLAGLKLQLRCQSYESSINPNNETTEKSLAARTIKSYANQHDFLTDENRAQDRQKILQTGLYRGKYASWNNDKANTDNANMSSGAPTITESTSISDNREFDDTYIELSDGSIVETLSSTGYQYTPRSEVNKKRVVVEGGYATTPVPELQDNMIAKSKNGCSYMFGIDSIVAQQKKQYDECGYVSDPIHIGDCSFIELEAVTEGEQPLEFYIIDGDREEAILPINTKFIVNERLMYQLPVRFTVDASKDATLYKDGNIIGDTIADKESFDYANHTYSVSYTPSRTAYKYFPKNETIQVKVLQRKSDLPVTIKAISIRKHGGKVDWTTLD